MAQSLLLADEQTARDLLTFAGRAARVGADGIRLQANGGVLRASVATLSPAGLLDNTPTVLGMRIMAADPELECDFVVDCASLAQDSHNPQAVTLPDTASLPAWAGVSPPQSGWTQVGTVDAHSVGVIATAGIAAVAEQVPTNAGEDVVRLVRAQVWGQPNEALYDLPSGIAFTADALGFLAGDEQIALWSAGRWSRISTARGHVLSRGPARSGLTEVRHAGRQG